ncbi:hypothetical protein EV182_002097 [Spiromyces aspiralis]|uniref:Uncharacterized protein n=1 Tax=Spiromyces aspiralis TaxID=68401 RepID=A0ACC1HWD8_9FUNG|nr:hypothetical protein EV182_002097 [Spiromyces aspiralis]
MPSAPPAKDPSELSWTGTNVGLNALAGPHQSSLVSDPLETANRVSMDRYSTLGTEHGKDGGTADGKDHKVCAGYPALTEITTDLHTTLTKTNATLTAYMFAMALFPLIWGTLADVIGRRYIYIGTNILFLGANIGCALAPNIAALIVFRIFQSAGASSILSMGAGTITDIYPRHKRGSALGLYYIGPLIGPVIGPVIGGYITQGLSWRWIFWILTILVGVAIMDIILFLPETHRAIVAKKYNMALVNVPRRLGWRDMNPLRTLLYLRYPSVAIIIFYTTTLFGCYYGITSSNSLAFETIYKLSQGTSGLCYIPLGVGNIAGSLLGGRLTDIGLRRAKERMELRALRDGNYDPDTPVKVGPEARLYFMWFGALLFSGCGITYGWMLVINAPLAVVLVLQFFIGFGMTFQFSATSNYLIDLFPTRSASIIACQSFCRSIWAGVCMLIMPIIKDAVGWGVMLTIFEGLCVVGFLLSLLLIFFGRQLIVRFTIKE